MDAKLTCFRYFSNIFNSKLKNQVENCLICLHLLRTGKSNKSNTFFIIFQTLLFSVSYIVTNTYR
ncbi:pyocin activator PrtN family protein [Dysgonomonas sp. 511]|uniref:pyocin activator PrtN family protein n=1 Tax=Dysgonomonas sp. 511 TaxID=2302930 RepID=UPI0034CE496C